MANWKIIPGCGKSLQDSHHRLEHRYIWTGKEPSRPGNLYKPGNLYEGLWETQDRGSHHCGDTAPWGDTWQIACVDCCKKQGLIW